MTLLYEDANQYRKKKKHFATNKRHLHLSLKSAND